MIFYESYSYLENSFLKMGTKKAGGFITYNFKMPHLLEV